MTRQIVGATYIHEGLHDQVVGGLIAILQGQVEDSPACISVMQATPQCCMGPACQTVIAEQMWSCSDHSATKRCVALFPEMHDGRGHMTAGSSNAEHAACLPWLIVPALASSPAAAFSVHVMMCILQSTTHRTNRGRTSAKSCRQSPYLACMA